VLTLAHRGDPRAGAENSVAALVAASVLPGVDGVEFDVRASSDQVPVLHDPHVRRVMGTDARVGELSAGELSALGIATLEEALARLGSAPFLDVEFKEDIVALGAPVLLAARGPAPRTAVLSSFDPGTLAAARATLPGWRRWLNVYEIDARAVAAAVELECEAVAAEYRSINERAFRAATRAGLKVVAWPVADRSTKDRLTALGVYAMCADGDALTA
jgi:glycerophosphoryl diester phosphodiesterase